MQAFFFWQCSTRPWQHSLTIAHDTTTTKILHKMTERYYRRLPRFCKPKVDTATRGQMLEFQNPTKRDDVLDVDPGLESSMQTTSLENAGAGAGILWLHLSEVARAPWQTDGGQEAMTTALQTVPHEPNTAVIKEATAQGAGNSFHMDWLQAENGESDYLAFFAPWWEEPTYVSRGAEGLRAHAGGAGHRRGRPHLASLPRRVDERAAPVAQDDDRERVRRQTRRVQTGVPVDAARGVPHVWSPVLRPGGGRAPLRAH